MMERRKETAKMRAVQSYKEAKAKRQSKIKSKKYHSVQRREKIKQHIKEFEDLQKTDPAEALKKLEKIERVRAEERASLRHRSTGKWAKNKQVQAKYDKKGRQLLAQQLLLSGELTQKLKTTGVDSESEEEGVQDSIQEKKTVKQIPTKNIDPNDIIKTKPFNLHTEIPDLLTLDDNEENVDQKATISQGDKQTEINGEKPDDTNLTLPGWGSWGGTGIKPSKRKNKPFIKKITRRDDNKGNLIINEKAATKNKPHLVSDVPFPFKKVKDFEVSIRAPIGNTFVPETAYRRMIKPAVKTKIGTIIEPMSDDILLRKKK